jgi:hypothetical protein
MSATLGKIRHRKESRHPFFLETTLAEQRRLKDLGKNRLESVFAFSTNFKT